MTRLRVADCGLRIRREPSACFYNPHSAIRNPHWAGPPATAGGSDLAFI